MLQQNRISTIFSTSGLEEDGRGLLQIYPVMKNVTCQVVKYGKCWKALVHKKKSVNKICPNKIWFKNSVLRIMLRVQITPFWRIIRYIHYCSPQLQTCLDWIQNDAEKKMAARPSVHWIGGRCHTQCWF